MKIGIIDWHSEFTNAIRLSIPDNHEVTVYDMNTEVINDKLDVLCNNIYSNVNHKYPFNYFAVPFTTMTDNFIDELNNDPKCLGIIDLSAVIKKRFPKLTKPVVSIYGRWPDLPLYTETGTKNISMINDYKTRFPEEYAITKTITDTIYGTPDNVVNDVEALKDARWLVHLKRTSYVCNAVVKALGCGVPVIMDTETFHNGLFERYVRHNENGIVLPADQIKGYLDTVDEATYARIKATCLAEAPKLNTPVKWTHGWWEPKAGGKLSRFTPSVMSGDGRLAPQVPLLLSRKKRLGSRSRRRRTQAVKHRKHKKSKRS